MKALPRGSSAAALPPGPGIGAEVPQGARGILAAEIAAAVAAVPGVSLTAGSAVAVATQYPGGTVAGVRLDDGAVLVQLTAERLPLPPLISAVRQAAVAVLQTVGVDRSVHVHVADLDLDGPALMA